MKRRFQLNMRRLGLFAWALVAGVGGTVGTLYLADEIFGFGLVFLVVTSVACTAIALTIGPMVRGGSVVACPGENYEVVKI
jgi:hypothetical protein